MESRGSIRKSRNLCQCGKEILDLGVRSQFFRVGLDLFGVWGGRGCNGGCIRVMLTVLGVNPRAVAPSARDEFAVLRDRIATAASEVGTMLPSATTERNIIPASLAPFPFCTVPGLVLSLILAFTFGGGKL